MITLLVGTAIILGLVLIALFRLKMKMDKEAPLPSRIWQMETAEELTPDLVRKPEVPLNLPDRYDETRLVLMVRDSEWLYAYWEISQDYRQGMIASYGDIAPSILTLRVCEIGNNNGFFDIPVGGIAQDWHIKVGRSSTPFYSRLGIMQGREFIPLAISNTVVTPRNELSNLPDEEWMLVTDHEQRLLKRVGQFPLDLSSPIKYGEN